MPFILGETIEFGKNAENTDYHLLIPFKSVRFEKIFDLDEKEILTESGKKVGKVISNFGNIGLAEVDKETLENLTERILIDKENVIAYSAEGLWDEMQEIWEEGKVKESN